MFNEKPRNSRPPLEGGDHPELDTSELCDDHQTKQFQTLIGQLQWLISLGRFDIAVHVMSLSRFRAQPRKGHLDRAKRIVGYLLFLPDGAIRFRTGEPDFSSLKDQEYDWTRSVYSGACKQIPHDIPKPLGKHVQTTHYVDANLHHDLATGKAVTAVLHFLNQTPIDAYTKKQSGASHGTKTKCPLSARDGRYACQVSRAQRTHSRPYVISHNGTQISASVHAHAGRPDSNKNFQLPPKIKRPNLHTVRYTYQCEQYQPRR